MDGWEAAGTQVADAHRGSTRIPVQGRDQSKEATGEYGVGREAEGEEQEQRVKEEEQQQGSGRWREAGRGDYLQSSDPGQAIKKGNAQESGRGCENRGSGGEVGRRVEHCSRTLQVQGSGGGNCGGLGLVHLQNGNPGTLERWVVGGMGPSCGRTHGNKYNPVQGCGQSMEARGEHGVGVEAGGEEQKQQVKEEEQQLYSGLTREKGGR